MLASQGSVLFRKCSGYRFCTLACSMNSGSARSKARGMIVLPCLKSVGTTRRTWGSSSQSFGTSGAPLSRPKCFATSMASCVFPVPEIPVRITKRLACRASR